MTKQLPNGVTQYVVNKYTGKYLSYHMTINDVTTAPARLAVDRISCHQLAHGLGGVFAVMYETHWQGLLRPPNVET